MNKLMTVALAGAVALGAAGAAEADTKIAVINLPQIISELPQTKAADARLKSQFSSRVKEVERLADQGKSLQDKLTRDGGSMSQADYTKNQRKLAEVSSEYRLKAQALEEDRRRALKTENDKILTKIQAAIEKIAKDKHFDIVLSGDNVAYAVDSINISDQVIQIVSKDK
ncbi:MAG: OmpH family outer membrane protein [Succinivibrionaceae bacterium]|jgi:outer membrane protein|nr:OmpH family outer membrane protein [Succinivibrionaceae bacterium]MDY6336035.1 OmpH family outer membrane protein [Succinivibrionaceae bacterium]MDY6375158.1 OmpH family outer membrane protein [Succinivibrionaceae bacterium]